MRKLIINRDVALISVIAICSVVTIFIILGRVLSPRPTTKTVASAFRECIRNRDAACTLRYVHPGEIQRLNLTADKVDKLFDVIDAETGYFQAKSISSEESEDMYKTLSFGMARASDTHEMWLGFQAMPTEHGPKIVGFVLELAYLPVVFTRRKGQPHAQGIAKVRLRHEQARWAIDNLGPIGIKGVVARDLDAGGDGLVFFTWSDLLESTGKRIAEFESRAIQSKN